MNELVPPAPNAALSPTLLKYAGEGQPYLGFISYRRGDALPLARWLRSRIAGFNAPSALKGRIETSDRTVGGRQNRVFLDLSYQKPNVDFWDEHIAASLLRSHTMILLQTPSVFESLPGGEPNWAEREIETFLAHFKDPTRILVVMGPGAPIDRFPRPLERISARWDWIDLRFFSESPLHRFRQAAQYDAQVAKVLAKLYDVADGDLPILNREFANARAKVRRNIAAAGVGVMIGLSGLTAWALVERSRAVVAEDAAIHERDEAIRQRNAALISQSRYLSGQADELVKQGSVRGAIALLRAALPQPEKDDRPLVLDPIVSAYNAILTNRERDRFEPPPGTTAIASDGKGQKIITASADKIVIRDGLAGSSDPELVSPAAVGASLVTSNSVVGAGSDRTLRHDFGAPADLVLAPNGNLLAMIGPDGKIAVRDLRTNKEVLRQPGEGPGTTASFLSGGTRLLIASENDTTVRLFDIGSGTELGVRQFMANDQMPNRLVMSPDSDTIAVFADGLLHRLSSDNLTDTATAKIDDAKEYAMTVSPKGDTIFFAAAKDQLTSRILVLDATTLEVRRTIKGGAGGARFIAVAPDLKLLALHGFAGFDFYELSTGERTYHMLVNLGENRRGRFIKNGAEYLAYGDHGSVHRYSPDLGLQLAAFQSIYGGAVLQIDEYPNGSGFLAISERQFATGWAFDARNISREYSIRAKIYGVTIDPVAMLASAISHDSKEIIAGYQDGSVRIWNLASGQARIVRKAIVSETPPRQDQPLNYDFPTQVALLDNDLSVVALKSGKILVYERNGGDFRVASELSQEPLSYLGEWDARAAFLVLKSGAAFKLDLTDASKPKLEPIESLATCPISGAMRGYALCMDQTGHVRVARSSDGKLAYDDAGPMATVAISQNGKRIAVSDAKGVVAVKTLPEGQPVATANLTATLDGDLLKRAAATTLLTDEQKAKVRAGAQVVEIPLSPFRMTLSSDGSQLAVAMIDRTASIIDLATGKARQIARNRSGAFVGIAFSTNGKLLALLDQSDLFVYDVASGTRIASIRLSSLSQLKNPATLHELADGAGFVAFENDSGKIVVNPVFEDNNDFISYLAREFPELLTPAQRRAYFIE